MGKRKSTRKIKKTKTTKPAEERDNEEERENEEERVTEERVNQEERDYEEIVNEEERENMEGRQTEDGVEDEKPEGEVQMSQEHEIPAEPKCKKHRGPTKMKNIAKDPNFRERVDFNDLGESVGPGSVKLSSYLGPLVREHVPVTFTEWRKITEELKTVLWNQGYDDICETLCKTI